METDRQRAGGPERARWRIAGLILLAGLFRLLIAALLPLGVDEAYALAVAREFSWAFFDHPPVGFWSPAAAALSGSEAPLVLRLPHLFYGAGSAWMIWLIGRELGGPRAGLWALALFGLSPAFALAGVFILPDGPLMMAGAFAVYWLVRIVRAGDAATTGQWLLAGGGLALALASKYHAGLLVLSVLIFALATRQGQRWFATPGPWLAAALALVGLAPVLWWNANNGWASFVFQGGRTGQGVNPAHLLQMLLGQALYLLPPVFVLGLIGLAAGLRSRDPARLLVGLIALGPLLFFNLAYLFASRGLPHWTLPGWQYAMPLAGAWLASAPAATRRRAALWLAGFLVVAHALILAALLHVRSGILTRYLPGEPPAWDRTIRVFDYAALAPALEARGDLAGIRMIATPGWIEAGAISAAFRGRFALRVLWGNPHHFAYMAGQAEGGAALLLEPAMLAEAPGRLRALLAGARGIDPQARALEPVILERGGRPYVAVNVIRLQLPPAGSEGRREGGRAGPPRGGGG